MTRSRYTEKLQAELNRLGFGPLVVDGSYGPLTNAAVLQAYEEAGYQLLSDLARDEGLRLKAYPDPVSKGEPWTIGHGHTGGVKRGDTITLEEARGLLAVDAVAHNRTLARVLPWVADLDADRLRVLQNMHFNLGWDNPRTAKLEGLAGFVRTLADIKAGRYWSAATRMEASLWAQQVGNRAKRLVAIMRNGPLPSRL